MQDCAFISILIIIQHFSNEHPVPHDTTWPKPSLLWRANEQMAPNDRDWDFFFMINDGNKSKADSKLCIHLLSEVHPYYYLPVYFRDKKNIYTPIHPNSEQLAELISMSLDSDRNWSFWRKLTQAQRAHASITQQGTSWPARLTPELSFYERNLFL